MMQRFKFLFIYLIFSFFLFSYSKSQSSQPVTNYGDIQFWLTEGNKSVLFSQQPDVLFTNDTNQLPSIEIDSTQKFQSIDGFGFCLTDGSAQLINSMTDADKNNLLKELFSTDNNSIGISYLRISIGSSDLSEKVYTFDDMPAGQTDISLAKFSIAEDTVDLIPILKRILQINPGIKILGSPWSAPSWMKDNDSSKGGSLQKKYFDVYASYFVKYIKAMEKQGIHIDAITPQNEPLNPKNNPSMYMTALDEADFIKNSLGPAFKNNNITTKIICYDHNADDPQYPLTILKDPEANKYVDGSAFHLYAGDISALTQVHNAFPDKNIYFTEQYTSSTSSFGGGLSWAIQNLIIGATKNWSRNVLEWNLASDPDLGPHTDGGCTTCLGALTINGSQVTRNQSYYIIAHASKFVRPGSFRIQSSDVSGLSNVAFLIPDGKKVLVVLNSGNQSQQFNIKFNGKTASTSLNGGAVGTYIW
ncbi:MAG TPA: glycoside hydrolase family 30 beta sandwich domain-containing protein [Hanamia sp.]|nr:glycoside hydrolase family 30 beta sandwich domain-containing protein [Hanamia sp.]